jgi:hypothetical protein
MSECASCAGPAPIGNVGQDLKVLSRHLGNYLVAETGVVKECVVVASV